MTRIIIEHRLRFGQFEQASTQSSYSSFAAPEDLAAPALNVGLSASPIESAEPRGDRLSPISRRRAPEERPVERAPSHRRGYEGPTTPKAAPAPSTPKESPKPSQRPSAPAPPHVERPALRSPSPPTPPRAIGAHDFASGLAPRQSMPGTSAEAYAQRAVGRHVPSVGIPPHAQRAAGRTGRGVAAVMHRATTPAPSTNAVGPATAAPRGRAFTRHIYEAARRAGIPETQARLAAAQAAHETDYGRRAPGHNYFGVKGVGTAGSQMLRTHEQGRHGLYATRSRFARYATPEDSLKHWWAKIQRQWPESARSKDFNQAVEGLRFGRRGGYATDVRYGEKIRRIADAIRPSVGASPKALAAGATPQGPVPPTSTAGRR